MRNIKKLKDSGRLSRVGSKKSGTNMEMTIFEEDPKLLLWYDPAVTRMGGE